MREDGTVAEKWLLPAQARRPRFPLLPRKVCHVKYEASGDFFPLPHVVSINLSSLGGQ